MIRLGIPFTRIVKGYDPEWDNITDGRKYLWLVIKRMSNCVGMREYRVRFGVAFMPRRDLSSSIARDRGSL